MDTKALSIFFILSTCSRLALADSQYQRKDPSGRLGQPYSDALDRIQSKYKSHGCIPSSTISYMKRKFSVSFLDIKVDLSLEKDWGGAYPCGEAPEKQSSFQDSSIIQPGDYYVSSSSSPVFLGPSNRLSATNWLSRGQKVTIFEISGDFGRISPYYNGGLEGHRSMVARWISSRHLSSDLHREQPPQTSLTNIEKLIKDSDEFATYRLVLATATRKLLDDGSCSPSDFRESGGWMKSSFRKVQNLFFVYCGGFSKENRIYLDPRTANTFR